VKPLHKGGLIAGGLAVLMVGLAAFEARRNTVPNLIPHLDLKNADIRRKIVEAAAGEIGQQDPQKYWLDVVPDHPGFHGDWCGGFALWAIHQGNIALGVHWVIGKGFCYQLPTTQDPRPGDIAYIQEPFQHHAIVESVNGDGTVTTIDGNQPGSSVQRRTRGRSAITAFFSIDPLLNPVV